MLECYQFISSWMVLFVLCRPIIPAARYTRHCHSTFSTAGHVACVTETNVIIVPALTFDRQNPDDRSHLYTICEQGATLIYTLEKNFLFSSLIRKSYNLHVWDFTFIIRIKCTYVPSFIMFGIVCKWDPTPSMWSINNYQKIYIDLFTNVSQIYGCFFPRGLVTSHFINLYLTMVFQYLESTLHTLVVATWDKPLTSFHVVRNNLC